MQNIDAVLSVIDQHRARRGLLSVQDVLRLVDSDNIVLDPFSTLIGNVARIGRGNVFYPGVIVDCRNGGKVEIGDNNTFYPNVLLLADQGTIVVGNNNQFGDGGVSIKANQLSSIITVGSDGRYVNGVEIIGVSTLGSGTQVIGNITVQNCNLEGGESFLYHDPDMRGAVMKGSGLARNISVGRGRVINGHGTFNQCDIEDQSVYHPKRQA